MDYIIGSGLNFEPPYNTRTCTLTSRFSFEDSSFGTAYLVWNGSTGSSCYYYCFVRGWMKNILNINISNCNYEYGKDFELYLVDLSGFQSPTSIDKIFTTSPLKLGDNDMTSIIKENDWNNPEYVGYVEIALIGKILNNDINEDIIFDLTTTTKDRLTTVKNIKQRTTNNSFNTYPIGMNAEFITIPAGTANLYENNVNTDEGMSILKNYIDEQLSNARVSFFVDYTDINNQVYNLRVYNDNTTNGQELRNTLYNIGTNEGTTRAISTSNDINMLDIKELYAPNFYNASDLFNAKAEMIPALEVKNINSISFSKVTNTSNMFLAQRKLQKINLLSFGHNVEDTSYMFYQCKNLTIIPNFNTSNVKYMSNMFCHCENLITIPYFNTSNVINMSTMFQNCRNLTNIPNLNTINVVNMPYMFEICYNLTNVPLFNTSNVINMGGMFRSCSKLTNVPNFNTSNVTNMSQMFEGCSSLTNIFNFDTRNVTNMSYMFSQCRNLTNIPNLNTINVVNMQRMFQTCYNLKSTINFNTSNVVNMAGAFYYCINLVNINKLNLNKVTEISSMIGYCNNLSNSSILNIANSLPHYNNIINTNKYNTLDYIGFSDEQISVIINNPYASNYVENHGWSLPKVNYELAYTNTSNPDVWINYNLLNQPITSNAKTLRDAFKNKNIDTANIVKLNVINLPNVTNGRNLFAYNGSNYNFSKMTNVEHLDMQDLQDASYLFYGDRNLISVNNINCNNINNCYSMFYNCNNLKNISNFNTSKVTSMDSMFSFSSSGGDPRGNLTIIPNFDTSNVTRMYHMFFGGHFFTTLPNFNTINVTNMGSMLDGCSYLTTMPNFNTSKVTSMFGMLARCYNLTTIPNFNTSNVTNMYQMFMYCRNLINIPNFNTSKVINMGYMFFQCYNLTTVPNFNTSNTVGMENMFYSCGSLSNQSIDNIAYSLPLYENIINGNPSINQYIGLYTSQINNMSINAKEAAENKGWMVLPQIRIDYTYLNGVNGVNKIYNIDTMTGQEQYQNLYGVLQNSSLNIKNITDIALYASDNNISNMSNLFYNVNNIKNVNIEINTFNVINMYATFMYCNNLTNISNLNTSKVTNMSRMFFESRKIKNIPNFDTSSVTDMSMMFDGCRDGLIDIPNLNTSNVINMYYMFAYCGNLIDTPSFSTSSVTNMYYMFAYCDNLSQNSLQNIIISIPDRDQITGTTSTTNLQYLGLTVNQINNLPTYYKQMAADKGWYVEGYEPKYTEMLVGTANALGDITFEDTETYPMRLTYDDMFGDYCLENTNKGKANTTSSAILTVSEELLNVFDPMFRFLVYYSSESADDTRIYKNGKLLYEYHGYDGNNYIDTSFWLEVKAGDVLKFEYDKDNSVDSGLDGCKIYISGWKNNKSYEVRYSTVDAPTTYITKFIPKEDN